MKFMNTWCTTKNDY